MARDKGNLAYTAGIVDGEGCISISKRKIKSSIIYFLVVTIVNTNPQLVEYLHSSFGGHFRKRRQYKLYRPVYCWQVSSKSAGEFLKLLFPYLLLKKPQAELAFRFQARRHSGGRRLTAEERVLDEANYTLMKKYNRRGIM